MRRTSILIEFEDDVYDSVVEPMKKNKTFAKLVASLVEGYLNDSYIRAYADDTIGEMRKASVLSMNESIEAMNASLSNLGMFTEELETMSKLGKKKFQTMGESALKDDTIPNIVVNPDSNSAGKVDEEVAAINKRMDGMQGTLDKLVSLVSELSSKGSLATVDIPKEDTSKVVIPKKEDTDTFNPEISSKDDDNEGLLDESAFVSNVQEDIHQDESTEEGLNFLQSMLEGNSFSF